jgi:hypothetical protein
MSAGIGQSCDIPIIIRALSCDLYQNGVLSGNTLDGDFLLALDGGSDSDDLSAAADSYYFEWWTLDSEPSDEDCISFSTIDDALAIHRTVTGIKEILPVRLSKSKYTWSRHLSFKPRGLDLNCNRCRLYRGVALGVMDNIQDLRHLAHGSEVGFEARSDITIRRAAGFFQLYDEAMRLESSADDESGNMVTKGKGKNKESKKVIAKRVQSEAAAEVRRLSDLPPVKWTWGVDLSTDDVVQLFRASVGPKMPRQPHSGYEISLPWGRYGEVSDANLSPRTSSCEFSDVEDDYEDVTELDSIDIPTHFTYSPLRHCYDELPGHWKLPSRSSSDGSIEAAEASWLDPPSDDFVTTPPMEGMSSSDTGIFF